MDECSFSQRLKGKVVTTASWRAVHDKHLPPEANHQFERKPFEHPSGDWYWFVCPCGAQHLHIEQKGQSHE